MFLPFSKPNEIKVLQYLLDECTRRLDEMNSISDNDKDEQLITIASGPVESMARLRLQERAVLLSNIKRLNIELVSIQGPDTREYYQERRLREMNLLRPLDDSEIVLPGDRPPLDDNY
jgi:hypothetical protein